MMAYKFWKSAEFSEKEHSFSLARKLLRSVRVLDALLNPWDVGQWLVAEYEKLKLHVILSATQGPWPLVLKKGNFPQ